MTTSRMPAEALDRARQDVLTCLDLDCGCQDELEIPEGEEDPANPEHYKDCISISAERSFNALVADHDRVRQEYEALRAAVAPLLDLPYVIDESTIPAAGPDSAPDQVVGTLHVSLTKMRALRTLLNSTT